MGVGFVPSLTNRDCSIPGQLREGRSERTQLSPRFLKVKLHGFSTSEAPQVLFGQVAAAGKWGIFSEGKRGGEKTRKIIKSRL